jgi:hypothetical protein
MSLRIICLCFYEIIFFMLWWKFFPSTSDCYYERVEYVQIIMACACLSLCERIPSSDFLTLFARDRITQIMYNNANTFSNVRIKFQFKNN